jgi:hypothetical protein
MCRKTGSVFVSNVLAFIFDPASQQESTAVNHSYEREVYHGKKQEEGADDDIV